MDTLTYIGVGLMPYGCALITATKNKNVAGSYRIQRLWKQNSISYLNISKEITESLKIMELPQEFIEKSMRDACTYKRLDYEEITIENWVTHYYCVVGSPDGKIKSELERINVEYQQRNQTLEYFYSEPKTSLENSLIIVSGLINDGLVDCTGNVDMTEIKREIGNLNPENIQNLSPQLVALSLAVGEAEFRRASNCEELPFNFGEFATNILAVTERAATAYSTYGR